MTDYFGLKIPFLELCGIKPVSIEPGKTVLRVTLGPSHDNSMGMAHGGLTLTLVDVAMGSAARSTLDEGFRVITVDVQAQFLEPGRGTLVAEGRVVRAGRSLIYTEADVRDGEGRLVARATGVMKAVDAARLRRKAPA